MAEEKLNEQRLLLEAERIELEKLKLQRQAGGELSLNWKKAQTVAAVTASILVPLVLGIVGSNVNDSLKQRELALKYVELSVNILREPPTDETKSIRKWALETLNRHSEVKLDDDTQRELLDKNLQVGRLISDQLGIAKEHLTDKADLSNDLGVDALDKVELMMALEEQFEIEIPDEDVLKLRTVEDILKYIKQHRNSYQ